MEPRSLNQYIKREHYTLPTVQNSLAGLQGAQFFSVLDASAAFLQMRLDEENSRLCTVATPFERFQYKTMPYGINSAPEILKKTINAICQGLEGIIPYMDNILVFGGSLCEHNRRLKSVLKRARGYNLKFNKKKLQLAKKSVTFLGYILSENGITIDSSKTKAIRTMESPANRQEV